MAAYSLLAGPCGVTTNFLGMGVATAVKDLGHRGQKNQLHQSIASKTPLVRRIRGFASLLLRMMETLLEDAFHLAIDAPLC
jgi:hypothetical protein